MTSPPIQYATTTDGVRIAFMSLGTGPAVVLASNVFGQLTAYQVGWPACKETTDRLVALGWRVILYDVRGMGLSDRDVEDLSLKARVHDLEAVVAHLQLERFALGGVDIGAATAIPYAADNPEKLSALVLVSPWASGVRRLQIPRFRAAYSAEPMANDDPHLFASIIGSVATGFADSDLVRQLTDEFLHSTTPAGLAAYHAANALIDLTDLLPQVKVPTLVIHEAVFPLARTSCAGRWRWGSRARIFRRYGKLDCGTDAPCERRRHQRLSALDRSRSACVVRRAHLAPHDRHSPDEARTTSVAAVGGGIHQQGDSQCTWRGAVHTGATRRESLHED